MSLPILVHVHIAETNEILGGKEYPEMQSLLRSVYEFSMTEASAPHGKYMLIGTFDGTFHHELLAAFTGSGIQPCMVTLRSMDASDYTQILTSIITSAGAITNQDTSRALVSAKMSLVRRLLEDCGYNIRIFSLTVFALGRHGDTEHSPPQFSWLRLINNVSSITLEILEIITNDTMSLLSTKFPKYTASLVGKKSTKIVLRVLTATLLNTRLKTSQCAPIMQPDPLTWDQLQKDGAIAISEDMTLQMAPLVMHSLCRNLKDIDGVGVFRGLKLLDCPMSPSWRSNEYCDASAFMLNMVNYLTNNPGATTVTVVDLFGELMKEGASRNQDNNIPLNIPLALLKDPLTWTLDLQECPFHIPTSDTCSGATNHLSEGHAFIGTGNGSFGDSWFPFRYSVGSDLKPFVFVIQSRKTLASGHVKASDRDKEYENVRSKLPNIKLFFIYVSDLSEETSPSETHNLLVISKNNMHRFYGRWLSSRRSLYHKQGNNKL
eukprot:TRINITY_DN18040_c0_g1_i1.p1 TRINITY_DN18040_c0_g1~~TRINITY_DN18040_c0_g1_i1.p1  ORF type:complete len:491 (+),score=61.73 TRINITY_DN18040_c0_g1_i1:169-1641(+)